MKRKVISILLCAALLAAFCVPLQALANSGGGYSVTYYANGATGGSVPVDNETYPYKGDMYVKGNTGRLVREGYVFRGWTEDRYGDGTVYTGGTKVEIRNNMSFYAKWTWAGEGSSIITAESLPGSGSNASIFDNPDKPEQPNEVTLVEASRAFAEAEARAREQDTKSAVVTFYNKDYISLEVMQSLTRWAQEAGMTLLVRSDIMDLLRTWTLNFRISFDPSKATQGIYLYGDVDGTMATNAREGLEDKHRNHMEVLYLKQTGSFGMPVQITVRLGRSQLPSDHIYFYTYTRANGSLQQLENTDYQLDWINNNEYLRFNLSQGGYIVISDGEADRND